MVCASRWFRNSAPPPRLSWGAALNFYREAQGRNYKKLDAYQLCEVVAGKISGCRARCFFWRGACFSCGFWHDQSIKKTALWAAFFFGALDPEYLIISQEFALNI